MSTSDSPTLPVEPSTLPKSTPVTVPPKHPWSPTAIAWICVLFTMLPAGIIYALNFERLGQPEKKKRALFLVLSASSIYYLGQIGVFFLLGVHPQLEKISVSINLWFIVISVGMAWYFYLRQQPLFKTRIGQGARKAPVFLPFVLSGLWFLAFVSALSGWATFEYRQHIKQFETAVAFMEKGEYRQAEPILKEFKTRYPDDTASRFNLTAIYLETDRVPQARQELKELLQQEPGNQEARDLLRDIESS